ncbi:MAG: CinA family protein [Clostridia bacterium]|nr:CinA family protein [Clostridia bacterium]
MTTLLEQAFEKVDALYRVLALKSLTVSTAESCTGGMIGACLTHPAGASRYYMGSIVAYDNRIKTALLGVSPDTLKTVGAVSEETAVEMAQGARKALATDLTVAVTGIAGPGGESPEKPQGLVYIAVYDGKSCTVTRNLFPGDRDEVRLHTVNKALSMLIERVQAY